LNLLDGKAKLSTPMLAVGVDILMLFKRKSKFNHF